MQKFRFHSLAIPHTVSNPEYNSCAYTQKVVKFSKMMMPRGHEIFHYGHEDSSLPCTEHITVTNNQVFKKSYGDYDWHRTQFFHNISDYANQTFTKNTIPEILKRIQPNDFVLCWWGVGHKDIATEVTKLGAIPVEPGIGYAQGQFAKWRAYESHSIRSLIEGDMFPQNWYSWVIPNFFDETEFEYRENKSDYFLFLSRIIESKGINIAIQATQHTGTKLKIAGQGSLSDVGYQNIPEHCEFIGYADTEKRRNLMSGAKALIIGTSFLEPFGGVQVESLLSGTPVIAPFYGAFGEVLEDGKTGFLCHNFKEYIDSIKLIHTINPRDCRISGMKYRLEMIAPKFEKWFSMIKDVYESNGWMST